MALPNNQSGVRNGVTQYRRGTYYLTGAEATADRQCLLFDDETDTSGYYRYPGSPEGNVPADTGSYCSDTSNGAIYVKTTDTVNTGWVLLGSSATDLHTARYIVSAGGSADGANYTTIASAYADAVSDSAPQTVFVQPGTYNEDITLTPGINISAYPCDASQFENGNVIIQGTLSYSSAGTVSISGIELQTDSANIISVTGANESILNLIGCTLNCLDNTGISFTSSDSNSMINCFNCTGNLGTTGIGYHVSSSAGRINYSNCILANFSNSTTTSTNSAGTVRLRNSSCNAAMETSSTGNILVDRSSIFMLTNTTGLTHNGSAESILVNTRILSGSASAISIGASGSMECSNSSLSSSNANVVTGSGEFRYGSVVYEGQSGTNDVTTERLMPTSQGNLQNVTKTATNLTVTKWMQYIGVTSTAAARTVTLPDTSTASLTPHKGQTFTIKDESGGASSNAITIATNGGNIDGGSSFDINIDYGSATVVFDGTNYWVS